MMASDRLSPWLPMVLDLQTFDDETQDATFRFSVFFRPFLTVTLSESRRGRDEHKGCAEFAKHASSGHAATSSILP
jgi:hypothetical protein